MDMVGKTVGRWKTIPTSRRSRRRSTRVPYTSCPSSSTLPSTRAPGVSSCIRLRVRRKVVLPHPDGPISACTWLVANALVTPRIAAVGPYQAVSPAVFIRGRAASAGIEAAPSGESGRETENQDDQDEDEGRSPGEAVPVVIRADRVGVHDEGKGSHRLPQVGAHELAAECREDERPRLARAPGPRQGGAGPPRTRAPGRCAPLTMPGRRVRTTMERLVRQRA